MIFLSRCLIVILGVAFLCMCVIILTNWTDSTDFSRPKIKFESFKKFYKINPNRWYLDSAMVGCKTKLQQCNSELFRFSFLDYLEYRLWMRGLKESKEQEQYNRITKRMMDAVKQDIANSEANAKQMKDKALDDLMQWVESQADSNLNLQKLVEEYKKIYEDHH